MTARELLKEARDTLESCRSSFKIAGWDYWQDVCASLRDKLDAYLAAPSESAMELVDDIREMKSTGYMREDFNLSNSDAAALIEGLQRRVPRKMLETIYSNGGDDIMSVCAKESIEATAAKYGVEVE